MEVTFAIDNAVGNSQRKRTYRACEPCKRRKKRCTHTAALGVGPSEAQYLAVRESDSGEAARHAAAGPDAALRSVGSNASKTYGESDNDGNPSEQSSSRGVSPGQTPEQAPPGGRPIPPSHRFLGDLNPETAFYTQGTSHGRTGQESQNDVGMWVVRSKNEPQPQTDESLEPHSQTIIPGAAPRDKPNIGTDASTEKLLPSRQDQSHLVEIYFSRIHPLLPLLDESSFRKSFSDDSVPAVLMKAVCLASSKDPAAKPHLRLGNPASALPAARFAHQLHASLSNDVSIKRGTDRLTIIRCLALMSLHSEGSDGAEVASLNLMQATHHTHTIGIHLGREQDNEQNESLSSLFWALWSLDRLNAAIDGRPVMMHDCDIGLKIEDVVETYDAPFRIWLRLSQYLDSAIELYRPEASASHDFQAKEIPSFEEIVDRCNGWKVEKGILASLETFYHAISILSCRLRTINKQCELTTPYLRQCNSARQIVSITQFRLNRCLTPLPVIPYAVSLSLSVAYRQLRQSRLETTRELAKDQVVMCAKILEDLSSIWWSANTMAKLARKALLELDKVANAESKRTSLESASSLLQNQPTSSREGVVLNESGKASAERFSQVPFTQPAAQNAIPPPAANAIANDPLPPDINNTPREQPPFDPNVPNAAQSCTADQAEIENIDAFLENFLDLQSSRIHENSTFLDYMDGLSQEYFNEMAKSTQLSDPSTGAGS